ncbi:MAG: thiamine-phosphate kinase [Bacillota bacterium]
MKISQIGEFGLIKRITGEAVFDPCDLIKGIGDDAAVIHTGQGKVLLVTSDMLVEGVHFLREKITPFQLGYKAVAVSFSDIAAMGGRPRHVLVSLAVPPGAGVEEMEEMYSGMKSILSRWSANLVGGDTVSSPVLAIDVTVLGEAREDSVLTRSGAAPGDVVMVTGSLGDSAAGLEIILNPDIAGSLPDADREALLAAHLRPEPRIGEASLLVSTGCVTSMMDLSDGLAGDIRHICDSSGTGAEIYTKSIPYSGPAARLAETAGKSVYDWALYGGEDYELLFTVRPDKTEVVTGAFAAAGLGRVTAVGKITAHEKGIELVDSEGRRQPLNMGFDHFKANTEF